MPTLPTELWLMIDAFRRFHFKRRVKDIERQLGFPTPHLLGMRIDGKLQMGARIRCSGVDMWWYQYEEEDGIDEPPFCTTRWMMDILWRAKEQITIEFPYYDHDFLMIYHYDRQ